MMALADMVEDSSANQTGGTAGYVNLSKMKKNGKMKRIP